MARKPRGPPKTFSGSESFNYLLAELELVVDKGNIEWSPVAAETAMRRLGQLVVTIRSTIVRTEREQQRPN